MPAIAFAMPSSRRVNMPAAMAAFLMAPEFAPPVTSARISSSTTSSS